MLNNLSELINSGRYGAFIIQKSETLKKVHPSRIVGFLFGKENEGNTVYVVLPARIIGGSAQENEDAIISTEKLFQDITEFKTKINSLTPRDAMKQLCDLLKEKEYLLIESEDFPNETFLRPSYKSIEQHVKERSYSEYLKIYPNG